MGHSRSSLKCPTSPPLYPCLSFKPKYWANLSLFQWRIQGRGPVGPPPLFLDQTKAVRSPKKVFGRPPPPPLFKGLDDCPSPCLSFKPKYWANLSLFQWRIQGRGPGGPPPLFLDPT